MVKTTAFDPSAPEKAEDVAAIRAEISRCQTEWEQIKQQMQSDQREIERLKAQNRVTLDQIQDQMRKF